VPGPDWTLIAPVGAICFNFADPDKTRQKKFRYIGDHIDVPQHLHGKPNLWPHNYGGTWYWAWTD